MRSFLSCLLAVLLGQEDPAHRAEELIRRLGSDVVEDRDAAMRGLYALGNAALPALEKAASDKDVEIAARARGLLLRLAIRNSLSARVKAILPGIEDRLDPDKPSLWTEALLKLVERQDGKLIHPEIRAEDLDLLAAPALRGAGANRPAVVREIGRWGLRSAAADLLPLLGEEDLDQSFTDWQVLKGLEAREIVPKVMSLLQNPNPRVRGKAVEILVDWNVRESIPVLRQLLEEGDSSDRGNAAAALIRFRVTEVIPALVARLERDPPGPFQDHLRVLMALRAAEAVPKLLPLLRSRDPIIRRTAAGAFSVLKVPEAVPDLGNLLDHEDEFTRYTALQALEAMRTPQAMDEIVRHGLRNKNPWLRPSAFSPLCNLGFREAIPEIIRALRDENPQVREGALFALGYLDAREAIPEIVRFLDEEKISSVLWKGVSALVALRAKESLPALEKLLARPELDVRQAALYALGELGTKALAPVILKAMEDPLIRREAARAAGRLQLEVAVPRLTAMLADERNFGCRLELAEALVELGSRDAVPGLLKILSEGGEHFRAQAWARRVRLNDRSFIPLCVEALKGKDRLTHGEAINHLRELQATEATPGLVALLGDPDKMIRGNALMALGGVRGREALPEIAKRLRDPEYFVRSMALWALRDLDGRSAVPDLLRQVEEDELLGMSAANLLAEWGVREVLSSIERRNRGGYASLRPQVTAIRFLLGDRGVASDLLKGIEWGEPWVAHRMIALAVGKKMEEAIPAIQSRLHDPDPGVQIAAATALIRLGRREGVGSLLDQHRGWSLLNRLRRPDEFRRLDEGTVAGALAGTAKQIAERVTKDAGLTLEGPSAEWSDDPNWDRDVHRITNVGGRLTRLQILDQVLISRFEFLCEPGAIRIVRRGEALQFWRAWWAEDRKK